MFHFWINQVVGFYKQNVWKTPVEEEQVIMKITTWYGINTVHWPWKMKDWKHFSQIQKNIYEIKLVLNTANYLP